MRSILGCGVAFSGLLAACRTHPDVVSSTASSDAVASSALSVAPAASSALSRSGASGASRASAEWRSLGKGVSWTRQERKDVDGRNTVWSVLRVSLSDAALAIVEPSHGRLEQLAKDPAVVAAVNGGFFETDGSASGLLVSHGRRMGAWSARGGSGVLVISERRARLVTADEDAAAIDGDVVLQCGPRLVEPDGTLGIRSDDGKRASRTVACIRDGGTELNLVLAWTRNSDRDGPGLYETAQWLREPLVTADATGCEAALNLDGGPSTGVVLRDLPDELHKPFGRVPFAIAVRDAKSAAADR